MVPVYVLTPAQSALIAEPPRFARPRGGAEASARAHRARERHRGSKRISIACSSVRGCRAGGTSARGPVRTRPRPHDRPSGRRLVARLAQVATALSHASPAGHGGRAARRARRAVGVQALDGLHDPRVERRRRSWSKLPYATSWVSACLKVYSRSGKSPSRRGTRPPADARALRGASPRAASAIACSRTNGTSLPMTEAVWSSRLSSGGSRSIRAASTACTVAGTWMLRSDRARR